MRSYQTIIASTYSSGTYGSSTYNGANTSTTSTAKTNTGTLTNTGIATSGIVGIAAALLLVAVVVRIWKRSNKSATPRQSNASK